MSSCDVCVSGSSFGPAITVTSVLHDSLAFFDDDERKSSLGGEIVQQVL